MSLLDSLNPFRSIHNKLDTIMAKLSTLEAQLETVLGAIRPLPAQLTKIRDEIVEALADVEIPEGAMAKINELGTLGAAVASGIRTVDDLNPDAPAPEPPPTP